MDKRKTICLVSINGDLSQYANLISELEKEFQIQLISTSDSSEKQYHILKKSHLFIVTGEYVHEHIVPLSLAKKLNKPTLLLMDGILEWRNWFDRPYSIHDLAEYPPSHPFLLPAISDYIACIGIEQKLLLDTFGNFGKTVVTGSPRLDEFRISIQNKDFSKNNNGVLVATAKTPAFSEKQKIILKDFLVSLKDYLEVNKIPVKWRISEYLAKYLDVSTSSDSLINDIQNCSSVLCTPSTLCLESMLAKKPTFILNPFASPLLIQSPWVINSPTQFTQINNNQNLEGALRLQDYFLQKNLCSDNKSTLKIKELVENILNDNLKTKNSKQSLNDEDIDEIESNFPVFFQGFSVKKIVPNFKDYRLLEQNQASAQIMGLLKRIELLEKSSDEQKRTI